MAIYLSNYYYTRQKKNVFNINVVILIKFKDIEKEMIIIITGSRCIIV